MRDPETIAIEWRWDGDTGDPCYDFADSVTGRQFYYFDDNSVTRGRYELWEYLAAELTPRRVQGTVPSQVCRGVLLDRCYGHRIAAFASELELNVFVVTLLAEDRWGWPTPP